VLNVFSRFEQTVQHEQVGSLLGPTGIKEKNLMENFYAIAKQSLILFTEPSHIVLIGTQDAILDALKLDNALIFVPTQYLNGVLVRGLLCLPLL
jgi:hypothetical protein